MWVLACWWCQLVTVTVTVYGLINVTCCQDVTLRQDVTTVTQLGPQRRVTCRCKRRRRRQSISEQPVPFMGRLNCSFSIHFLSRFPGNDTRLVLHQCLLSFGYFPFFKSYLNVQLVKFERLISVEGAMKENQRLRAPVRPNRTKQQKFILSAESTLTDGDSVLNEFRFVFASLIR